MLSRLKGMETIWWIDYLVEVFPVFGYAFPFEGNGNKLELSSNSTFPNFFGYAFPFEGNGNLRNISICMEVWTTLDMLSRWKGMETCYERYFLTSHCYFGYAFPFEGNGNPMYTAFSPPTPSLDMLSRWKGMETAGWGRWVRSRSWFPLDMLSRWKGMETRDNARIHVRDDTLDMLSRWKGMETHIKSTFDGSTGRLWICFPVGREWKPVLKGLNSVILGDNFGYAFPLEGNGN